MDFKLEVNQSLKLMLSVEMKMSIEMLKMSAMELKEFIEKKSKENPAIEISYSNKEYKKSSSSEFTVESFGEEEESLIDFLQEQIGYLSINRKTKDILFYLINNLDEKGYLVGDLKDLSKGIGVKLEDLKNGLEILQKLEPYGVGARSLEECLLIQIRLKKVKDLLLENIIKYNLNDIGENRLEKIVETYGITKNELLLKLGELRKLNPKPARGYSVNNKIEYVVPDIIVNIEDSKMNISLNKDYYPTVKVKDSEKSGKNISSALSLVRAIEKRQNTLLKIGEYILKFQEKNIIEKRPLNTLRIKDIAFELGYHESTVSRAVKDKYIKINNNIKKLKEFVVFSSEREVIRDKILFLVGKEDKRKPLSDEKILEELKKDGFKINRRTITKYRDELGIGSSRKRKKESI